MTTSRISARVSADGTVPAPAAPGEAQHLLVNEHGALWTAGAGGGGGPTSVTISGPIAITDPNGTVGATAYVSAAAAALTAVITPARAKLVTMAVVGAAGVALTYVQLHNASAVPSAGAIPRITLLLYEGQQLIFEPASYHFATGIVLAVSTTLNTYTAGGSAVTYYAAYAPVTP